MWVLEAVSKCLEVRDSDVSIKYFIIWGEVSNRKDVSVSNFITLFE